MQLAVLLLHGVRAPGTDEKAYASTPPLEGELSSDEKALSWEGEGWEEFYEAG